MLLRSLIFLFIINIIIAVNAVVVSFIAVIIKQLSAAELFLVCTKEDKGNA